MNESLSVIAEPGKTEAPVAGVLSVETTPVMHGASIGRRTALSMAILFLMLIGIPPLHQFIYGDAAARFAQLTRQFPDAQRLKEFESDLARESGLAASARRAYRRLLTLVNENGTENVVEGSDHYLFFRKEIDFCMGPGFLSQASKHDQKSASVSKINRDSLKAITHYNDALKSRGIHLLLVPAPLKPMIYPEKLAGSDTQPGAPACNSDFDLWLKALRADGVDVLDLRTAFWTAKHTSPNRLFLSMDTHWSPAGVDLAAHEIAGQIKSLLSGYSRQNFAVEKRSIENRGDLYDLLDLPQTDSRYSPERVEITTVQIPAGPASVLLIGDSFTNVYSSSALKWGEHAGLGEQLALKLGAPVEVIAQNGGGATGVRKLLAQNSSSLSGKNVLVWEFSTRDLYDEKVSWDEVPLPSEMKSPAPQAGNLKFTGELLAIATAPTPGRVPYRECLIMAKYKVVKVHEGNYKQDAIFVNYYGMRNNLLTAAAKLAPGSRHLIACRPMNDELSKLNLADLSDDPEFFTLTPFFGESFEPAKSP